MSENQRNMCYPPPISGRDMLKPNFKVSRFYIFNYAIPSLIDCTRVCLVRQQLRIAQLSRSWNAPKCKNYTSGFLLSPSTRFVFTLQLKHSRIWSKEGCRNVDHQICKPFMWPLFDQIRVCFLGVSTVCYIGNGTWKYSCVHNFSLLPFSKV